MQKSTKDSKGAVVLPRFACDASIHVCALGRRASFGRHRKPCSGFQSHEDPVRFAALCNLLSADGSRLHCIRLNHVMSMLYARCTGFVYIVSKAVVHGSIMSQPDLYGDTF